MTKLALTPSEKKRAVKHEQILNYFKEVTNKYPNESTNRKLREVAEKYKMTVEGVKKIIKANGLYQPKTSQAQ